MDPISAIFVMTVLTGLFVKGVDVATDGLLSAEVGAGIRGAGSYTARDVRDRWRRGILDDAAAVGRTGWTIARLLFGEARQFGSGIRSEWRTARDQARSVRTERRGDAPWPVTQWLRDGLVRLQETRTKTPNEETEQPNETPNGDPEPSPFAAAEEPFPACPDCGMPLVVGTLADHRAGLDRCSFADMDDPDDPNGDPPVPLESTVPNENGDVRCGCCAQLHKPLAPGEHCPDCHIHDHPSQSPNAPTTKGPSMDINSAPAAIAAAETFRGSFETLQSRADALAAEWDTLKNDADTLHGEIATFMDSMGDFAIGGEADTAASVGELSDSAASAKEQADNVVASISTAKETVDAYIDNLHLEYDASIEAAAGKAADVHSVMQEA